MSETVASDQTHTPDDAAQADEPTLFGQVEAQEPHDAACPLDSDGSAADQPRLALVHPEPEESDEAEEVNLTMDADPSWRPDQEQASSDDEGSDMEDSFQRETAAGDTVSDDREPATSDAATPAAKSQSQNGGTGVGPVFSPPRRRCHKGTEDASGCFEIVSKHGGHGPATVTGKPMPALPPAGDIVRLGIRRPGVAPKRIGDGRLVQARLTWKPGDPFAGARAAGPRRFRWEVMLTYACITAACGLGGIWLLRTILA